MGVVDGDKDKASTGAAPAGSIEPGDGVLLNPATYAGEGLDPESARLMRETIGFFEQRGKRALKEADHERSWYRDFLDFQAREGIWSKLMTPERDAGGNPDRRWDTNRNCHFNEITAFYGLAYWYTWQVSMLGLGPIYQSDNEEARRRAAKLAAEGAIFAFGLSEREHGADIYSTDMVLTPRDDGGFEASGGKYYIGNGNEAGMVSVFGRRADIEGPEGYVFFAADSGHPGYRLIRNVVNSQNYVSQFELDRYPVEPGDVLHTGAGAFEAALNTINICKFNLGFASIGICTHAFYEAITHAEGRVLYGNRVTEFPHVSRAFTDAYARLVAMKLFACRAIDYMRSASEEDRRYLLYNPLTKMKVTTEGERVIDLLWDVIAAKGFEKDMYFEMAARDVRALPKLEGTVHVNMALVLKFMAGYLFDPQAYDPVPKREDPADDEFLFHQGPTKGLSRIRFRDWRLALRAYGQVPNVALFAEQAESLGQLLHDSPPDEGQRTDLDFLLTLGELFSLIPYAQLICEEAELRGLPADTVDHIFDVLVRDFSGYAVELHGKGSSTPEQRRWALSAVRKPEQDAGRFDSVWAKARGLAGAYEMSGAEELP